MVASPEAQNERLESERRSEGGGVRTVLDGTHGASSRKDANRTRSETPGRPATSRDRGAGKEERLLLDFGWRFHFGHANDAAKDFGFGSGRSGGFQKTGGFLSPSSLAFDDSDWKPVDLPHDWAIGLPFTERPGPVEQGVLSAGPRLPGNQRRLVPPRVRTPGLRRGQAHLGRVRRRLPRDDGRLQRLLHRPAQRRLRSVQLRRDRLRQPGQSQCAAGPRGRHAERRLVLRGRGHLPARLAGEDRSGAREEVGHVRARRGAAGRRRRSPSGPRWRTTARARGTCA